MRNIAFVLLLAGVAVQAEEKPVIPDPVKANINARIAAGETAGIVVGFVGAGGETYMSAGVLEAGKPGKVDPDTIFEIGSVTKAFTGILLADMVKQGQVKLDDPVRKYLPDTVQVPKDKREITLLDLATHHSGLPRMPDNFSPADPDDPYVDYTAERLYAALAATTLNIDIGKAYAYSNLGAGLLGHALSRAAKTSYDALVRQRIATPLGMKSTSVQVDPAAKARVAQGYEESEGKLKPVKPWTWKETSVLVGAGGLHSTARDMIRFVAANAGLTETKLQPALAEASGERDSGSSADMEIGLGWHRRIIGDRLIVWHNGATGGFHSYCAFDTDNKVGVVVLSNSTADVDDIGLHLLDLAAPLKEPVKAVVVPEEKLAKLDGWYDLSTAKLVVTHEGNQLYAQYTGQGRYPVFAQSPTVFVYKVVPASLEFAVKEDGTVTGVTLHQNGRDLAARRMSAAEAPKERVEITVAPKILAELVGKYRQSGSVILEVKIEGNHLAVQFTGQPWFDAYAETPASFFLKKIDAQLTFARNSAGKVDAVILHQAGVDQQLSRVP